VALKEECQSIFKLPIYAKEDVIEAFRDTEYDIKDDVRKYIVEFWNKISDYSTPNVTNSIIQKLRVSDITLITYGDNNAEYVLKNKEIEDEFYAVLKSNGFSPVSSGKIQSSLFENTDDLSVFDGGVLVEILRETARNTTGNGSLSYLDVIKMIMATTIQLLLQLSKKSLMRHKKRDLEKFDKTGFLKTPKYLIAGFPQTGMFVSKTKQPIRQRKISIKPIVLTF
jgi:hypothetical protein